MSIYAMSDLHLSFGCDKPMDIFGWENYTQRIKANWQRIIGEEDTLVMAGDFSWGLKLEETLDDFKFIESLPGKKIFLKGNHDLWWSTLSKIKKFLKENDINSVDFILNNAIACENHSICGTRGWLFSSKESDKKIIARESARLETSIKAGLETGFEPLVFMHFPPAYGEEKCQEIIDVLKKYDIKTVYYGHVHGKGLNNHIDEIDGIKLKLISCDCLDFTPYLIY